MHKIHSRKPRIIEFASFGPDSETQLWSCARMKPSTPLRFIEVEEMHAFIDFGRQRDRRLGMRVVLECIVRRPPVRDSCVVACIASMALSRTDLADQSDMIAGVGGNASSACQNFPRAHLCTEAVITS